MKIAVGSKNPVKIQATELAFKAVWPEKPIEIISIDTISGVSEQPMSHKESIIGARNRATSALKNAKSDYGVGLEGGIQEVDEKYYVSGWIVVVDKDGSEGIGSTVNIEVPKIMADMILAGKELGEVSDIVFQRHNSKHAEGHFGIMTNNLITRTEGYKDGVISALARFIQSDIFSK